MKKITKLATIRRLPEIIKNGKLIDDNVANQYNNDGNNKSFAYIEHTLEIDGKEVTIRLDIKKSPQKNKFWVHRVWEKENVRTSPASTNDGTEAGHTSSDIDKSITQPELIVKELHSDREDISVYDLMGEKNRLIKENEKFKAEIERLKEALAFEKKVTGGNIFNEKQLGAVANALKKKFDSTYDKVELMKMLRDVYRYISTSDELSWNEVFARCYAVADEMLNEVKPRV